jgi:hypothetical protein
MDGSLSNLIFASGQLCAHAASSLWKEPQYPLHNRRQDEPQQIWIYYRKEKSLDPAKNRTPDHLTHSLVTV